MNLDHRDNKVPVSLLLALICIATAMLVSSCSSSGRPSPAGHGDDARFAQLDSMLSNVASVDSLAKMMNRYHDEEDLMGEMLACKHYGNRMHDQSRFADALAAHERYLNLAVEASDTIEMVNALNNLGTDCRRQGNLTCANDNFFKALKLCDAYSDQESTEALAMRVSTLNGIGKIEIDMCNYPMADSVLREALEGEKKLGRNQWMAVDYAHLGAIKRAYGETDSAWYFYRKSLECNQLADSKVGTAVCHMHFGELHEDERRFAHAQDEYVKAYDQLKALDEKWYWLETCLALANVSVKLGEKEEAKHYLREAEEESQRIGSRDHQARAHMTHYELALLEGNPQEALQHFIQGTELLDSIYGLKKNDEMRVQIVDYERTRASGQMDVLNKDIARLKHMRNMMALMILALSLMAGGIIAVLVYAVRVRSRTQRVMRQVEETRSLFFTNVVHQLRTPLSAIMSATDGIIEADAQKSGASTSPDQRNNVEIIERQGNNLLLLVDRILEMGGVLSAVKEPDWRTGDGVAFLHMVVESYRDICLKKHIELSFVPREKDVEIDIVPHYLNTIVGNLIENAVSYSQEYSKITVTSRIDGNKFTIRVADTGMGISKTDLPHVFEPFYRAATAERIVEGVGIGLTVVRDMAMAMGGTVAVDSMLDRGSVFTVVLPCRHRENGVKERLEMVVEPVRELVFKSHNEESRNGDSAPREGLPVVLVIEDHGDVAHLIGAVLGEDYEVHYASDGEQGLSKAAELSPDLIVTDVKMPLMDGCELCRRLRASRQLCHIPVLMLSARTGDQDRIRGIEAGADVYMVKPFVAQELRAWAKRLIESRVMLREVYTADDESVVDVPVVVVPEDRDFLKRFAQLVEQQVGPGTTKVNLDRVAREFKMGESQLRHKVQDLTGKNVAAYITQLRMEKALRLLTQQPDMLIGTVAEECGFADVAYFSRVFRQHYKMTPTQARNATPN